MEVLKINIKDYSLNSGQLNRLMEEFYGKSLASGVEDEFVEYAFKDDAFDSQTLYEGALKALEIFKIRN